MMSGPRHSPPADRASVLDGVCSPDADIRTVSVIGAGAMGRGIAAANVRAGIRVRISDVNQAAASAEIPSA